MEPHWSRERRQWGHWSPSKSLIASIHAYQEAKKRRGPWARACAWLHKRRCQFWSAVSGADIDPAAQLGPGLALPHPNGVVIHADAVVGANCMLMQQVTLGQLAADGAPRLGDGVYVGAGAKVLGAIHIGDGAAVGANAVVLHDVPARATAVGVPARVIERKAPK
jgi:serine O-acetyltransferase